MKNSTYVMIPGPTPVVKSIRDEMAREVQAFGDPRFVGDYKQLIEGMQALLNCSGQCFPLAGTGTLAMEMAIANSTKSGDRVLVISNGFFGDRFIELAERKGLIVDILSSEWGTRVSVESIRDQLLKHNYAAITVTHVDTSTAVVAQVSEIGNMLRDFPETLFILDGVAATGGEYVDFDAMRIDILFTGSQKAFGVCPGMFILWASKRALKCRQELGVIPEYYVDFEKWLPIMDNPSKYFATPAVNLVWALNESLRLIQVEGYENRCDRHSRMARAVAASLEAVGISLLANEKCRASTLSCVLYPVGVEDSSFRSTLYDEGVIVGGGLGAFAGKMFRLGHMGHIDTNDMVAVLGAIERALHKCGHAFELGTIVGTFQSRFESERIRSDKV